MARACVLVFVLLAVSSAIAYKNGFTQEACETLCPFPDCTNSTTSDASEINRSERGFPYSGTFQFPDRIRRTTPFKVNMSIPSGLAVNALMLVFHGSGNEPLGHFSEVSNNLRTIACSGGPPNALTNRDFSEKNNLWFVWMPPDLPDARVSLKGTFVFENEYWYNINVKDNFNVDTFPPSMSSCGKKESCVTVSRTAVKCEKASRCDLTLSYVLTDNNRTLEITLGGVAPEAGRYLAIGFTDDRQKLKDANIFACTRTEALATVEHFTLEDVAKIPVKTEQVLEEPTFELDGERVWCKFRTPVQLAGYDLVAPHYQLYFYGKTDTNTGVIEIGPKYVVSKERIEIGVPLDKQLTSGALTLASLCTLLTCMLLLQHVMVP